MFALHTYTHTRTQYADCCEFKHKQNSLLILQRVPGTWMSRSYIEICCVRKMIRKISCANVRYAQFSPSIIHAVWTINMFTNGKLRYRFKRFVCSLRTCMQWRFCFFIHLSTTRQLVIASNCNFVCGISHTSNEQWHCKRIPIQLARIKLFSELVVCSCFPCNNNL